METHLREADLGGKKRLSGKRKNDRVRREINDDTALKNMPFQGLKT